MKRLSMLRNIMLFVFLLIISIAAYSQTNMGTYAKEWAQIDSLITKADLPKTALGKINQLYEQSFNANVKDQTIKCLLYQLYIQERLADTEINLLIKGIQSALKKNADPIQKAILNTILAKQYWDYYNQNSYQLFSQTNKQTIDSTDVSSFSVSQLHQVINFCYEQALKDSSLLQQTPLSAYQALVIEGNDEIKTYSLYDLLAFEALNYYKGNDFGKPDFISKSIWNNADLLAPTSIFSKANFPSQPGANKNWRALQLYQSLLKLHEFDTDPSIFIQLNIERIKWIKQMGSMPNKNGLYENALKEIIHVNSTNTHVIRAYYLLAQSAVEKARSYSPYGDTSFHNEYNVALNYLAEAKKRYGATEWEKNGLVQLYNEINERQLFAKLEKINLPKKPFRALINYRNTDSVYGRVIKIDPLKWSAHFDNSPQLWHSLSKLAYEAALEYKLPAQEDHQQHATEIKIDGLPTGSYILLLSSTKQFDTSKDHLSASYFSVSNITYFRDGNRFFLRNWENGQPISGATINVFTRENQSHKAFTNTSSDENGLFRLKNPKNNQPAFCFEIKKGNQYLFSSESEYLTFAENINPPIEVPNELIQEQRNKQLYFFKDRSIYRPGQKIQFKAIAITRGSKLTSSKLYNKPDNVKIYLRDANQQKIDSLLLLLNEFGSISGQFTIPLKGLTGNYSLTSPVFNNSSTYFSVEEYKQPKFTISFQKNNRLYRYDDSVFVKGSAIAFAGNNINNAKISYTIKQQQYLMQPYNRKSYPTYNEANAELISGETFSNALGEFTIPFKALKQAEQNLQMLTYYTIEASATDINGETQNSSTMIVAGNTPLQIQINLPTIIEKKSFSTIQAIAKDAINQPVASSIQLSIAKINQSATIYRKRIWQRPDQFILSAKEYHQYFPEDEYNDESNLANQASTRIQLNDSILQPSSKMGLPIPAGIIEAGWYKINATCKDSFGVISKAEQYIQVYDVAQANMGLSAMDFLNMPTIVAKPSDTALFITGSSIAATYLVRKITRKEDAIGQYSYERKNGIEQFIIIPSEKDRGNIIINDAFIYKGQFFTKQYRVEVPWDNKKLTIEYSTQRKLYEPGNTETWSIKINGSNVAAELLTGMYDASLDALKPHQWNIPVSPNYIEWASNFNSSQFGIGVIYEYEKPTNWIPQQFYSSISLASSATDFLEDRNNAILRTMGPLNETVMASSSKQQMRIRGNNSIQEEDYDKVFTRDNITDPVTGESIVNGRTIKNQADQATIKIRKNFNETAFFFPQLLADSVGNYQFSFTLPDAVTKWKWMSLAHTKGLAFGINTTEIITQKTLMVQPNAPRFLREGDHIELSSKIANLSDKALTGTVTLELLDASTNNSVDGWFQNVFPNQYFTVEPGQSENIRFPIQVPFSFNKPLTWRIVAKAENFSDAEENSIPVITNRQLVTETLPIFLPKDSTINLSFNKLLNSTSSTATNQQLTVEYTSNPVWNVVKALPYLMLPKNESAEQLFHQLYANQLAAYIVQKNPRIKSVFEAWKKDSSSLKSNLLKNEELKQTVLAETPWVMDAENETEQQKRIANLFETATLNSNANQLINALSQLQLADGSFPWFKGGNKDVFITQTILTGIGKLKKMGAIQPNFASRINAIVTKALNHADDFIHVEYDYLIKNKIDLNKQVPNWAQLNYLYMRSFYSDIAVKFPLVNQYFYQQSKLFWNTQNAFTKAKIAIIAHRNNEKNWAVKKVLPALLENAINQPQQGIYWKNTFTNYWYQSPIEFQTMMINCFSEINTTEKNNPYTDAIEAMRTWLILNKQTNHWNTTIATADACYALLMSNGISTNLLNNSLKVEFKLGNQYINNLQEKQTAGSGFFQKNIPGEKIEPSMGNIQLRVSNSNPTNKQASPSYGAIYWQYIEDLDKIAAASNEPLSLTKEVFVERNTPLGKSLVLLKDNDEIVLGEKLVIQLNVLSNRDMDYIQIKDLRASAMEPLNVLSGYQWQQNLSYYKSTKDVSTHYFINHLSKGRYTLSYECFANQIGIFSVGIASVQSMYAPEFTGHSAGINLRIKEK